MRKRWLSSCLALALFSTAVPNASAVNVLADDAPKPWGATPSEAQMYYYHQGLSGFVHYGTNTYRNADGIEWGNDGQTTAEHMQVPDTLDTDQWVKVFQDAGFGRIIYTAKHHDGFRNWHTDEYSTKQSEAQVDILEKLSKSCSDADMDMGLYLSPWDVYEDKAKKMQTGQEGTYGNGSGTPDAYPLDDDYNKLFERHLKEIFENDKYGSDGDFVELWLDGAKNADKEQTYDYHEWIKIAKELNGKGEKELINFQGGDKQEISWPGNERGEIDKDMWSKLRDEIPNDGTAKSVEFNDPEGELWTVWEGDFSIRPGWFYHKAEDNQVKTPEVLFERYLNSVGHGGVMLLNIPPNREGRFHETDIENVMGFAGLIEQTFGEGRNLARGENVSAKVDTVRNDNDAYAASMLLDEAYDTYWTMNDEDRTAEIEIDLGGMQRFDLVELQEYIPLGQRINEYSVEVQTANGWQDFGEGTVIGYKQLIRGPVVNADKIRIHVHSDYAVPIINNVGVYKLPKEVEQKDDKIPTGLKVINDKDMTTGTPSTPEDNRTDAWYLNRKDIEGKRNYIENDATYLSQQGYKEITFTGSKFYIRGAREINKEYNTDLLVTIDNGEPIRVDASTEETTDPRHPFPGAMKGMVLYTSPDLPHGEHTVRMEPENKTNQGRASIIDAFLYCDNPSGMFEFEEVGELNVLEGGSIDVTVRRLGDSSQAAKIRVASYPGTAVHGEDFTQESKVLEFQPNEIEKTLTLETLDNFKEEGTQYFTVDLESVDAAIPNSYNMSLQINIRDNDSGEIPPEMVTGISLEPKAAELRTGQQMQLKAVVQPDTAENKSVRWSSDHEEIASVDSNGNVTAHREGTAKITARTKEGGFMASCDITVKSDSGGSSGGGSSGGSSSGGSSSGGSSGSSSKPNKPEKQEKPDTTESGTNQGSTGIPVIEPNQKTEILGSNGEKLVVSVERNEKGQNIIKIEKNGQDAGNISGGIQVALPTTQTGMGVVAKLVNPDASEKILMDSYYDSGKVIFNLESSCTIQIENLAKTFDDVHTADWYKDAVDFVSAHGMLSGQSATVFAPSAPMTRAMLTTVLYRLEGQPSVDAASVFTDIDANQYYAAAVAWASRNNYVSGMTDTLFSPNRSVTREQLASILYRYAGSPSVRGVPADFSDAGIVSDWANDGMNWAVQEGIISGTNDNRLNPQGNATRAEVASILMRFVKTQ